MPEDKKPASESSRNKQGRFTGGKASREAGRKGGRRSRGGDRTIEE